MSDPDILLKIMQLAREVCRPSRGVTPSGEPTISFTLSKTKQKKGNTIISIYRCRFIRSKTKLSLKVNDKQADNEDAERVYCLLLELHRLMCQETQCFSSGRNGIPLLLLFSELFSKFKV